MKSNGPHPSRDGHHPRAAVVYGILQTALTLGVCYLFFDLDLANANYWGALLILAVCSVSLVGFGVVAAELWSSIWPLLIMGVVFVRASSRGADRRFQVLADA